MLLDVNILERRRMAFGDRFRPGTIQFSGSGWKQLGELEASGSAELLNPQRGAHDSRSRPHSGSDGRNLRPLSRCRRDPARSGLRPFLLPDERHSAEGGDRDRYLGYRSRLLRRAGAGTGRCVEGTGAAVVAHARHLPKGLPGNMLPMRRESQSRSVFVREESFRLPLGSASKVAVSQTVIRSVIK